MRHSLPIAFIAGISVAVLFSEVGASKASAVSPSGGPDVESLLEDFVSDYRTDATSESLIFGIEVRDAEPARWHVWTAISSASRAGTTPSRRRS